jgi:hypothetical protein
MPRGRPASPARAIACPTCGADGGVPCIDGSDLAIEGRYHAARMRAAGLEPYASGPSGPSGHQRGHPERRRSEPEYGFE